MRGRVDSDPAAVAAARARVELEHVARAFGAAYLLGRGEEATAQELHAAAKAYAIASATAGELACARAIQAAAEHDKKTKGARRGH